jgi:hypothetical protein
MKLIENKYLSLPGLYKIKIFKDNLFSDLLFFIFAVALPSSFFALVNPNIFYKEGHYDLDLFVFIFSCFYLLYYFPNIKKIPFLKSLLLLCAFTIFQLFYSYLFRNIPLREILTIFRKNFCWPITTLGLLSYCATMNIYRLERFFRWVLLAAFYQSLLYIISNLIGIDIFARVKEPEIYSNILLLQNTIAVPQFLFVPFLFGFFTSLVDKKFKADFIWISALIVSLITIFRGMLITYLFSACFILFLYLKADFIQFKSKIPKLIKLLSFLIIIFLLTSIIFPYHINALFEKFGLNNDSALNADQLYNFNFRIKLIKNSYESIKDKILLGHGYIRETFPGYYDLVLGQDTLVAPVLYTEGVMGISFRIFPLLILLVYSCLQIKKKRDEYFLYYAIIIVIIISELFVNIIQTTIFTYYNRFYFIMILLIMIIKNNKKANVRSYLS